MFCSVFNVQCSTHFVRQTFFFSCILTCLHPHTNWSNLIIAIIKLSQLDLWSLRKAWIWLDLHHQIGIIRHSLSLALLTVSHFLCILFCTSCAQYCFINIPILINCCQLIGVTLQPTTTSSQFKQITNSYYRPVHNSSSCAYPNRSWCLKASTDQLSPRKETAEINIEPLTNMLPFPVHHFNIKCMSSPKRKTTTKHMLSGFQSL